MLFSSIFFQSSCSHAILTFPSFLPTLDKSRRKRWSLSKERHAVLIKRIPPPPPSKKLSVWKKNSTRSPGLPLEVRCNDSLFWQLSSAFSFYHCGVSKFIVILRILFLCCVFFRHYGYYGFFRNLCFCILRKERSIKKFSEICFLMLIWALTNSYHNSRAFSNMCSLIMRG